eukprot:TRINITY_DN15376_c0_g1_i1.p1 TRINITY_DN15376_c0_g1~~TRINITY_DN15376_c0_g1_i1.p1  ORF type:complete len:664 (+),score=192.86 TRINITY_DN15376_c0_g1_i1:149-2140(+)
MHGQPDMFLMQPDALRASMLQPPPGRTQPPLNQKLGMGAMGGPPPHMQAGGGIAPTGLPAFGVNPQSSMWQGFAAQGMAPPQAVQLPQQAQRALDPPKAPFYQQFAPPARAAVEAELPGRSGGAGAGGRRAQAGIGAPPVGGMQFPWVGDRNNIPGAGGAGINGKPPRGGPQQNQMMQKPLQQKRDNQQPGSQQQRDQKRKGGPRPGGGQGNNSGPGGNSNPQRPGPVRHGGNGKKGAAPDAVKAALRTMEVRAGNFKSTLNELVMKISGRPLAAGDVIYAVKAGLPREFQASVKAAAIDENRLFEGTLQARKRDAEQSAAEAVLQHYIDTQREKGEHIKLVKVAAPTNVVVPVTRDDQSNSDDKDPRNFKSALNEIITKVVRRPMTASDVVYNTQQFGQSQYVSSVKIVALEGDMEFAGESRPRRKTAEQSAAEKAVEKLAEELESGGENLVPSLAATEAATLAAAAAQACQSLPQSLPPGSVSIETAAAIHAATVAATVSLAGQGDTVGTVSVDAVSQGNYKSVLNELVMKAIARPLSKGDVTYHTRGLEGGFFVSSVEVSVIEGGSQFQGEVTSTKKDAEQTAAKVAFAHYQEKAAQGLLTLKEDEDDDAAAGANASAASNGEVRINIAPSSALPRPVGPVVQGESLVPDGATTTASDFL